MTDEELRAHAAASARLLGMDLPPGADAQIAAQLRILLEHAANFTAHDLPPELDPLPEFDP